MEPHCRPPAGPATSPAGLVPPGGGWGAGADVRASRLGASGWSAPVTLERGSARGASPRVAADGQGGGLVVWAQDAAERADLWSSRWTRARGFEAPQAVEASAGQAPDPDLALGAGGGLVTWTQRDGDRFSSWSATCR